MSSYSQPIEELFGAINSSESGLSPEEAENRLSRDGLNTLPTKKVANWIQILLRQFKSPLIYLLLIAAGITIWLGELTDTIVIGLAVTVNVGIGFYQEFHSGNIFKSLLKRVKSIALVLRGGSPHEIPSENIARGDVILLKSGSKIPADARLITATNLQINESLLTGESTAVTKKLGQVTEETVLADRTNMVYMGTTVETGDAQALVVATGRNTEIGKIAELTKKLKEDKTPLQERIAHLGRLIATISGIAVVLILIAGIIQERAFFEMLTIAVAVAVAAIPEGLPAALSVVLAVGASRIYRKKGLIKRLIAAETLGSTTVICTDKTGTLTEGKMKLEKMHLVSDTPENRSLATNTLGLVNEAIIEEIDGEKQVKGESTDQAKMNFFLSSGATLETVREKFPQVAFLPFDNFRKYMASVHTTKDGLLLLVNGAVESLLERSSGADTDELQAQNDAFADQSFRVIGLALRKLPANTPISPDDPESLHALVTNLTFIGMGLIRDPIRSDVNETMEKTRGAGVDIIMLTGDHRLTARAIGKELGFETTDETIMEGRELDTVSDTELKSLVTRVHIFARVTPTHKLRIVHALQANGEAVTMTGDGVNDTPSLKAADIGVALGSGTDIAKEASELVLLDNSFSTIVAAVEQGRIALDNIRKVVVFLLNGAFTEIILVMGALLLGLPLPLTAVQILWINLVEDGLPNFALAFEKGEKDVMRRPPVPREERILNPETRSLIFIAGLLGDILLIGLFFLFSRTGAYDLTNLQTFFFAAVGTDALISVFALKSLKTPLFKTNIFTNPYLLFAVGVGLAIMIASIYTPFLNGFLGTTPLSLPFIFLVFGYLVFKITSIEIIKWRYTRRIEA